MWRPRPYGAQPAPAGIATPCCSWYSWSISLPLPIILSSPSTSPAHAVALAESLRHAAEVIAAVLAGRNLNQALDERLALLPQASAQARAAIQDLSYATLRAYGRGDFLLARLLAKPLSNPRIRALLLIALQRLATRPEQAHTTVDQAVTAAAGIAKGSFKGLVNGVLRNYLRRQGELEAAAEADPVARAGHPAWWIKALRRAYPGHWEAILAAGNSHPPMALRPNTRQQDAAAYLGRLEAAGIAASLEEGGILLAQPLPVTKLPGFAEGAVSVQDLGAQQAARWLDVAPGQRVLDACAAPGGKAAHILERADVQLTALDADATRARRITENLQRLGLEARVQVADCRRLADWWDGTPYDRILADVPCSASGVVRRHPDAKWLRRNTDVAGFAATQGEILESLWQVLKPGGKLLYATCSVFPEENSEQIRRFLATHAECVASPLEGDDYQKQLLPEPRHDGFYYALLQKRPA